MCEVCGCDGSETPCDSCSMKQSSRRNVVAQDWFGHAIALQFAIAELRQEITVDVCQENPRLVCLAIAGLQARADELIAGMKAAMVETKISSAGFEYQEYSDFTKQQLREVLKDGRQRLREAGLDGTDSTGG